MSRPGWEHAPRRVQRLLVAQWARERRESREADQGPQEEAPTPDAASVGVYEAVDVYRMRAEHGVLRGSLPRTGRLASRQDILDACDLPGPESESEWQVYVVRKPLLPGTGSLPESHGLLGSRSKVLLDDSVLAFRLDVGRNTERRLADEIKATTSTRRIDGRFI